MKRVLRWVAILAGVVLLTIGGLRLVAIATGGPLGPIPGAGGSVADETWIFRLDPPAAAEAPTAT